MRDFPASVSTSCSRPCVNLFFYECYVLPIKPYFISRSQIYHIRTVLSTLPRLPFPTTFYPYIPSLPGSLFLFHYWAVYPKLRNCHSSSRFPRVTNKTKLVGGESRSDERGRRCKGSMFELGGDLEEYAYTVGWWGLEVSRNRLHDTFVCIFHMF